MLLKQKQIFNRVECDKIINSIGLKKIKWDRTDRKYDSNSIDYSEDNKWIFERLKDFSISGKSLSFEKLKSEVDKCILVCSNCHSEIHEGITKI